MPGAVYVYSDSGTAEWSQQHKLLASDGTGGDRFGYAVAVYNYTIAAGAIYDDDKGSNAGV